MSDCLLLQTVSRERIEQLLDDPAWCLQQKYDGVRLLVTCEGGQLRFTARSGRELDPGFVGTCFPTDQGDYFLDGELAYGHYFAFDALTEPGRPYLERLTRATELVESWGVDRIRRVRTWRAPDARGAFELAEAERLEGVVMKRLDAPWFAGTDPAAAVRFKFWKRAEVVVLSIGEEGRRSAIVGLYDARGDMQVVGRVPIGREKDWQEVNDAAAAAPADREIVLEVQYLYATDKGQLYQPTFIRVRYDKSPTPADCSSGQLITAHKGEIDGGVVQPAYDPAAAPAARETASTGKRQQPDMDIPWGRILLIVVGLVMGVLGLLVRAPGRRKVTRQVGGSGGRSRSVDDF